MLLLRGLPWRGLCCSRRAGGLSGPRSLSSTSPLADPEVRDRRYDELVAPTMTEPGFFKKLSLFYNMVGYHFFTKHALEEAGELEKGACIALESVMDSLANQDREALEYMVEPIVAELVFPDDPELLEHWLRVKDFKAHSATLTDVRFRHISKREMDQLVWSRSYVELHFLLNVSYNQMVPSSDGSGKLVEIPTPPGGSRAGLVLQRLILWYPEELLEGETEDFTVAGVHV